MTQARRSRSSGYSFGTLNAILFLSIMIPILVVVGLVVYGLQQQFLVSSTRDRLKAFVESGVAATPMDPPNLSRLAVSLGERLRILGADLFIQNAAGEPVAPSLGTGPWLSQAEHSQAQQSKQATIQQIATSGSDRLVYLSPVLSNTGEVLGTIEASLSLDFVETSQSALRRWLVVIIAVGAMLAAGLSLLVAQLTTRPLSGLVQTAKAVAQGYLNRRAPQVAVNEVQQVSLTFNVMLDRIQEALKTQAQLTEEIRRFAADASHELRSPLAVFRNSVDMLEKAMDRQDMQQIPTVLGLLRGEVEAMTILVDNLLLLARLERPSGSADLTLHEVEAMPLLEEVYERCRVLINGQQLNLEWPSSSIGPLWLNRELVRRALNNLVENAIYHTPAGKKITLKVEDGQAYCRFIVQDEGEGIPTEILPHIFERFYRGDHARSRGRLSTGLGLAIVRAIAMAHAGDIKVFSEVGIGTTMVLSFPRKIQQKFSESSASIQHGQIK
jgi:two-component system OmpR family sensor kinase